MSDSAEAITARWELARSAAIEAGKRTLEFFYQRDYQIERKSDDSPVTEADRQAEQLLRRRIRAAFPQDALLGEEFGQVDGTSGFRWILDPIDGTKSFISGVPLYATLVGVEHQQRSVIGVIYIPGLDECVDAAQGQGAWHTCGDATRTRARVSSRQSLTDGLFITSQIDSFAQRAAQPAFERLQQAAYITRTWGDGYGYLLVATGRCEAMVDPAMELWDAAALQPILQEAGGTFTDWQGEPTIHNQEGIGTNGHVLQQVLEITREFPRLSHGSD